MMKRLVFSYAIAALAISALQCEGAFRPFSEFSCILKPSPLGGIGVFATHDSAAGTPLLRPEHCSTVRTLKIKDVPLEFLKYCVFISLEECTGPRHFDHMEIGWYLNHSATPNIAAEGSAGYYAFKAIRDIQAGEEILLDYNELGEPEALKEEYYRGVSGHEGLEI